MEKFYIFFIALFSVTASFAQDRNQSYGHDNQQRGYNKPNDNDNDRYRGNSNNDRDYKGRQQQMQEIDRRAAIDRVNRDYDQRISRYRNDRSMNARERDRRIVEAQRERQQQVSAFGKGAITGAVVGLIAGVLFSR